MIKVNFKYTQEKITFVCNTDYLYIYTNNYLYKISTDRIFYFYNSTKNLVLFDQENHRIIIYGSWENAYDGSFGKDITLHIHDVILYRLRKIIEDQKIEIKS
jgi:hypothetical protein